MDRAALDRIVDRAVEAFASAWADGDLEKAYRFAAAVFTWSA